MPFLLASQREWLLKHGTRGQDGKWSCKATGAPINCKLFQHYTPNPCCSINDFLGGRDGNAIVREVIMLYCTTCDAEPDELPPNPELVEVTS